MIAENKSTSGKNLIPGHLFSTSARRIITFSEKAKLSKVEANKILEIIHRRYPQCPKKFLPVDHRKNMDHCHKPELTLLPALAITSRKKQQDIEAKQMCHMFASTMCKLTTRSQAGFLLQDRVKIASANTGTTAKQQPRLCATHRKLLQNKHGVYKELAFRVHQQTTAHISTGTPADNPMKRLLICSPVEKSAKLMVNSIKLSIAKTRSSFEIFDEKDKNQDDDQQFMATFEEQKTRSIAVGTTDKNNCRVLWWL